MMWRQDFFCALWFLSAGLTCGQDLLTPRFETQVVDDKIQLGYNVAVADVDGDSKADIILADKKEIVWYQAPEWKKHVIASSLTFRDHVCLAARDINGDGRAEIAVGAQWNPGETSAEDLSGAVFYLHAPDDRTQRWTPVRLTHEPTVHRMRWVKIDAQTAHLIVAPLHGRGNDPRTGEGAAVKVLAYALPTDPTEAANWKTHLVDQELHLLHNFDVKKSRHGAESVVLGGKEGLRLGRWNGEKWVSEKIPTAVDAAGVGEVRILGGQILATIEPMHGSQVKVYHEDFGTAVLDRSLAEGHALALAPVSGGGFPDIIAGWREPDAEGKTGIKLYQRDDTSGKEEWKTHRVDEGAMACEDLTVADLDGDQRLDIVACGRATKNVIIYWNRTEGLGPINRSRPALPPLEPKK